MVVALIAILVLFWKNASRAFNAYLPPGFGRRGWLVVNCGSTLAQTGALICVVSCSVILMARFLVGPIEPRQDDPAFKQYTAEGASFLRRRQQVSPVGPQREPKYLLPPVRRRTRPVSPCFNSYQLECIIHQGTLMVSA